MSTTLFIRITLACGLALVLCSLFGCAVYPPTQAGNTANKGMNNMPVVKREKRHF